MKIQELIRSLSEEGIEGLKGAKVAKVGITGGEKNEYRCKQQLYVQHGDGFLGV